MDTTIGSQRGNDVLGNKALGNDALDNNVLGNKALDNDALGNDALDDNALSENALGRVPAQAEPGATVLDRGFGADEIAVIRHAVQECLVAAGFTGDRLQAFVLAVNEVITNVVLHAGGHGRIALRPAGESTWCTVTDSGPGIPERFQHPPEVPGAFEVGGRGIWLAYRLCDEVTMATGPIGTTIGLRMAPQLPSPLV